MKSNKSNKGYLRTAVGLSLYTTGKWGTLF